MATSDSPNEPPRSDSEGPSTEAESSSQPFLARTSTHNAIFYILAGLCVGLFAGDALYHKHTHFEFEGWFGYYAFFGFFAYMGIVFIAKALRTVLKREEDYYGE